MQVNPCLVDYLIWESLSGRFISTAMNGGVTYRRMWGRHSHECRHARRSRFVYIILPVVSAESDFVSETNAQNSRPFNSHFPHSHQTPIPTIQSSFMMLQNSHCTRAGTKVDSLSPSDGVYRCNVIRFDPINGQARCELGLCFGGVF